MARAAHQQGALTIAVVTRPFSFEGPQRSASAALGIENLRKEVDALIVIPNDRLLELSDRTIGIVDAFKTADTALLAGVQGITDLITSNSTSTLISTMSTRFCVVPAPRCSASVPLGERTAPRRPRKSPSARRCWRKASRVRMAH